MLATSLAPRYIRGMRHDSLAAILTLITVAGSARAQSLPVVEVTKDNTPISASCIVKIPRGTVIRDEDGNGVIHIAAPNIVVEFAPDAELWGGPRPADDPSGPWDRYSGIGVRIDGHRGVTLRNLRVHGFKVGVWATKADSLTVEAADLSDNFRQRLRSTPAAEDGADWLYPHRNDNDEWAKNYGGALYVKESSDATIRDVRVRRGQNGILLNRVNNSRIYDNDCSFISGWGLAMFRSSGNTVTRNAFDFCVRGHVEGVYNRGQDSAGILMFEQCSNNIVAQNSATHGGDGIFGFAGLEALNAEGAPQGFDHTRKGCNDNLFIDNDLSYAPAHGLEMTFSFGNLILRNRMVENAICGVWGGYSQDTLIAQNTFAGNGGMAYGLERGGINIEHGSGNLILANRFENNKCAVHLWSDPHGDFETKAWGKANYKGVVANVLAGNTFVINNQHPFKTLPEGQKLIALQLRQEAPGKVRATTYTRNVVEIDPASGVEFQFDQGIEVDPDAAAPSYDIPPYTPLGRSSPVGARSHLRGRDKIIMNEWGPWDHASPMIRVLTKTGGVHTFQVFGAQAATLSLEGQPDRRFVSPKDGGPIVIPIEAPAGTSVFAYKGSIKAAGLTRPVAGTMIAGTWNAAFFSWTPETDPRERIDAWRALAANATSITLDALKLDYGMGGPRDQAFAKANREAFPANDRFGMIATTTLRLPKGSWKFSTLSDDGIRVLVNGKPVIENWTWHAPTRDSGTFLQPEDAEVTVTVEHFEIDGFAVLNLDIEPL